jgi:hypothetical protein
VRRLEDERDRKGGRKKREAAGSVGRQEEEGDTKRRETGKVGRKE